MKQLKMSKLAGTGNDFLFINLLDKDTKNTYLAHRNQKPRPDFVKQLCHRQNGVGADGVVFIEPSTTKDVSYQWDFYNSDGSTAEMCGNAARCMGFYAHHHGIAPAQHQFQTIASTIEAFVQSKDHVEIVMPNISNTRWQQKISNSNKEWTFDFIDSGVPHCVIHDPEWARNDQYRKWSHEIQHHSQFQPQKTNVTFFKELAPGHIESASFERGVEDFTLACGTGATAAALSYNHNKEFEQVIVQVPGGKLEVRLSDDRPILIGPVKYIADIFFNL